MHLKRIRRDAGPQGMSLTILLCPEPGQAPGEARPAPAVPPAAQAGAQGCGEGSCGGGVGAEALPPMPEAVEALVRKHALRPFTVVVPGDAPATKELWEAWCVCVPLRSDPF